MRSILWRSILAALAFCACVVAPAKAEDAILVLDASGSMWGQIEGRSKVEIARDVMGSLLDDLPAERRLGLMAYGHHRRGDCSDIELIAPVGADREQIRSTVNRLNALGMTPISESVRRAAEELRYTEQKATVILVSDGEETCSADPCEVGAALEAAGVDFTAHVIGFDITDEKAKADLQCLADTTGGRFVLASNADELSAALEETVIEEPAPAPVDVRPARLTLQATELEDGPVVEAGLAWTVTKAGDGASIYMSPAEGEGVVETEIEPGIYDVAVVRGADGQQAQGRALIEPEENETLTLVLNPVFEATLSVEPEASAPAGSEVMVTWTGPDRQGDWIGTAAPDFNARAYIDYVYTRDGSPLAIRLPAEPGDYEIRYVLNNPTTVLAAIPITATPVEATLEAAPSAAAESQMAVTWTGPDYPGDWIGTAEVGSSDASYITYSYTRDGSPLEVQAPSEPGTYELRYVLGQGDAVLTRITFEVTANQASVSAPEAAPAGSQVQVTWSGPNYGPDYIATAEVGSDDAAYLTYEYTRAGSPLSITLPDAPKAYEIRYVLGDSRTVLARTTIEATAVTASFEIPETAPAGATIAIPWDGPGYNGDYLAIVEPGSDDSAYINYATLRAGQPAEIRLPDQPGDYEIRYVLNQSRTVIARAAVTLTPVEATLEGPESATTGSEITVSWTGPAYNGDYLAIAEAGSADSAYITYATVRAGDPSAEIRVPDAAGSYEIRYVLNQSRTALARIPLEVKAP
jgi:Ca-activated chloride channel family protein